MAVTGIEDRRYWNWVITEESRFQVVAYLHEIWWFEVDGGVKLSFPADIYTLSFRLLIFPLSLSAVKRSIQMKPSQLVILSLSPSLFPNFPSSLSLSLLPLPLHLPLYLSLACSL